MKNQEKGITLIALIITIIVMLILVGVTINVALNAGLFEKAKTAASQTEQEKIYEELIASCVYKNNGEINVLATYNAFKEIEEIAEQKTTPQYNELTEVNTKNIVFVVKGKTGNYAYSITTGKIIKGEIPFVSNDLTTSYINYDKKYVYDRQNPEEPEFFVKLESSGYVNQYIDENTGEERISCEELMSYNPAITNTSITVGGIVYEIIDNDTLTLTSNQGTFTYKIQ